ncbi:MAG TPA: hypothetical protein VK698_38055 [Kofleriaceae bacterium]|nr:hypothetical protein [Kofleriaceae bacterium]
MSEYQFYEFRAIDRALGEKEMRTLRAQSSRARITSTSFINDYSWSDFRGNEDAWMHRYFDAFLYLASWGKRAIKLRLPAHMIDADDARRHVTGRAFAMREKNGHVVLSFLSDRADTTGLKGEGKLSSFIGVRAALTRGDLRSLYLGWLLGAQSGELADDALEPPVPVGLAQLDGAHQRLVEFLRLDPDLLAAAARASRPIEEHTPPPKDVRAWLADLAQGEKDEILERLLVSDDPTMATKVIQRLRRERSAGDGDLPARPRTAAELIDRARQAAAERSQIQAEMAARESLIREQAAAAERAQRLEQLAGSEPILWDEVDTLIATRQSKSYDHAVALLVDLRDLSARSQLNDFPVRLQALYAEHLGKPSLIHRMQRAGL